MTDRELLEFAANAVGYTLGDEVNQFSHWDGAGLLRRNCNGTSTIWAPLYDDGDVLRLAVRLNIFHENIHLFYTYYSEELLSGNDKSAAARRAIVRAAAEIGKDN